MQFKKIDEKHVRAGNVSKTGALSYVTWHDEYLNVYVQIVDVFGGSGAGNGTFSQYLFPIDSIGDGTELIGYDPISGLPKASKDRNMPAFLRAVKDDVARRTDKS